MTSGVATKLGVGEGVGDDLGAEVEVGVGVADEDRGQRLAGVEDRGDQAVAVGAGEAGVDQQRLVSPVTRVAVLFLEPTGKSRSMTLKSRRRISSSEDMCTVRYCQVRYIAR